MNKNKNIFSTIFHFLDIWGFSFLFLACGLVFFQIILFGAISWGIVLLGLLSFAATAMMIEIIFAMRRRKREAENLARLVQETEEMGETLAKLDHDMRLLSKDIENLSLRVQLLSVEMENSLLRIALIMSGIHLSRDSHCRAHLLALPEFASIEGECRRIDEDDEESSKKDLGSQWGIILLEPYGLPEVQKNPSQFEGFLLFAKKEAIFSLFSLYFPERFHIIHPVFLTNLFYVRNILR